MPKWFNGSVLFSGASSQNGSQYCVHDGYLYCYGGEYSSNQRYRTFFRFNLRVPNPNHEALSGDYERSRAALFSYKQYLLRGSAYDGSRTSPVSLYDPNTKTWKYPSNGELYRSTGTSALIGDMLYNIAGMANLSSSSNGESYNLLTETFSMIGNILPTYDAYMPTGQAAIGNKIYLRGGFREQNTMYVYDTITKTTTKLKDTERTAQNGAVTRWKDKYLMYWSARGGRELYNPVTDTFTALQVSQTSTEGSIAVGEMNEVYVTYGSQSSNITCYIDNTDY